MLVGGGPGLSSGGPAGPGAVAVVVAVVVGLASVAQSCQSQSDEGAVEVGAGFDCSLDFW
jgi:hypothetical protein